MHHTYYIVQIVCRFVKAVFTATMFDINQHTLQLFAAGYAIQSDIPASLNSPHPVSFGSLLFLPSPPGDDRGQEHDEQREAVDRSARHDKRRQAGQRRADEDKDAHERHDGRKTVGRAVQQVGAAVGVNVLGRADLIEDRAEGQDGRAGDAAQKNRRQGDSGHADQLRAGIGLGHFALQDPVGDQVQHPGVI